MRKVRSPPPHLEELKANIKQECVAEVRTELETTKEGWVEVVRKNLKQEARKTAQEEQRPIVQTTLEEERMRQARRLNVRVTRIQESTDTSPEQDGRCLCTILGYREEDPLPFTRAWRVGRDLTRSRALVLQFPEDTARTAFLRRRAALHSRQGPPIYLDEDLTRMQIEHRCACMLRVMQPRREGRRAFYRDGRVIIDGRPID